VINPVREAIASHHLDESPDAALRVEIPPAIGFGERNLGYRAALGDETKKKCS